MLDAELAVIEELFNEELRALEMITTGEAEELRELELNRADQLEALLVLALLEKVGKPGEDELLREELPDLLEEELLLTDERLESCAHTLVQVYLLAYIVRPGLQL